MSNFSGAGNLVIENQTLAINLLNLDVLIADV